MNRFLAMARLLAHFNRDLLISGWTTAHTILFRSAQIRPGFVEIDFADLPDRGAHLVAALVTLTPGTTTVDIDLARRKFVLHLLDLDQAEQTLEGIRRDFIGPARIIFGGMA